MEIEKELSAMSRDERTLLLYLETRAVDHGGAVDTHRMNGDDMTTAKEWAESGFIGFGRIVFRDAKSLPDGVSHWVELSERAWQLAHLERRNRAKRMSDKRTWRKTSEKEQKTDDQKD